MMTPDAQSEYRVRTLDSILLAASADQTQVGNYSLNQSCSFNQTVFNQSAMNQSGFNNSGVNQNANVFNQSSAYQNYGQNTQNHVPQIYTQHFVQNQLNVNTLNRSNAHNQSVASTIIPGTAAGTEKF